MPDHIKTAADMHRVVSPEQWRQQALEFGQRNGFYDTLTVRATDVQALINAGRWLIVCPWCNNAPATHPDWRLALCYECGSEFSEVTFPGDEVVPVLEELLVQRPIAARNWTVDETLEDLAFDNHLHEVPA